MHSFLQIHSRVLLLVSAVLLLLAGASKMRYQFERLLVDPTRPGAIDLKFRHQEVHAWFEGRPVYQEFRQAVYPPASYVLLWPSCGWLSFADARKLWALTTGCVLAVLLILLWRGAAAAGFELRALVAGLMLSMSSVGVVIGNGQLILHVLPPLLAAALVLDGWRGRLWADATAAVLLTVALAKPTVTAGFVVALLACGYYRALWLTATLYVCLTLFAASFQPANIVSLLLEWVHTFSRRDQFAAGFGNVYMLLYANGFERFSILATLVGLAALFVWVRRNRTLDIWLLLGVTAVVARFVVYMRPYDDVLMLIAEIAIVRCLVTSPMGPGPKLAGLVILVSAAFWAVLQTPRVLANPLMAQMYPVVHAANCLAILVFLLWWAGRERRPDNPTDQNLASRAQVRY